MSPRHVYPPEVFLGDLECLPLLTKDNCNSKNLPVRTKAKAPRYERHRLPSGCVLITIIREFPHPLKVTRTSRPIEISPVAR